MPVLRKRSQVSNTRGTFPCPLPRQCRVSLPAAARFSRGVETRQRQFLQESLRNPSGNLPQPVRSRFFPSRIRSTTVNRML
jgi:hypothetical protein